MIEVNDLLNAAIAVIGFVLISVLPTLVSRAVIYVRQKWEELLMGKPEVVQAVLKEVVKFAIKYAEDQWENNKEEFRDKLELAIETAKVYLVALGYNPDFLPIEEAIEVWLDEAKQEYYSAKAHKNATISVLYYPENAPTKTLPN